MSDSEKPFEATPRRVAKARREGNVARSAEVAANLSFAAAGLAVVMLAPAIGSFARNALALALAGASPARAATLVVLSALLPAASAALAGTAAALAQSGGLVLSPVTAKAERLDPFGGLRRILSRDTAAHSARASLAFVLASGAMAPAIAWCAAAMVRSTQPAGIAAAAWKASQEVAFSAVAVGSFFALAEYGAARAAWLRKLRMSLDDRKREAKEEEGDAVARGRRRALHRALLRGAIERVKEASFVVANPTHVAVALKYDPPSVEVPHVLVRAAGDAAARVRELARLHGIPIVEHAALARALFRDGRSDAPIPPAHYVAVASIVAALSRREGGR